MLKTLKITIFKICWKYIKRLKIKGGKSSYLKKCFRKACLKKVMESLFRVYVVPGSRSLNLKSSSTFGFASVARADQISVRMPAGSSTDEHLFYVL